MTTHTAGVKQLICAEKRASEKIAEARKYYQHYLKKARDEAVVEAEKYKQQRLKQFEEYESTYFQGIEQVVTSIDAKSAKQIEEMKYWVAESKGKVIDLLLEKTFEAVPQIHRNYHRVNAFHSQKDEDKESEDILFK